VKKGNESTEKQALDWNPQRTRRKERLKQIWKMTTLEEAGKCDKMWSKVGGQQSDGDASQITYVPNGTNRYPASCMNSI
jgi:hypothetical protein